jgi:hypothetical protein
MPDAFNFELESPERLPVSSDVEQVLVSDAEGDAHSSRDLGDRGARTREMQQKAEPKRVRSLSFGIEPWSPSAPLSFG